MNTIEKTVKPQSVPTAYLKSIMVTYYDNSQKLFQMLPKLLKNLGRIMKYQNLYRGTIDKAK